MTGDTFNLSGWLTADGLEDYFEEGTKRYRVPIGIRFFNTDSIETTQGELVHRIDVVYDPADPLTCKQNVIGPGREYLESLTVSLGAKGQQVLWPSNPDKIVRCPVPTEIFARDES